MPVRVLVVDDSSFFRRQIEKLLSTNLNLEVVGSAKDGREAVEKALKLLPDVITMDIEMPVMDGIEATREIMCRHPIPILMFSSLTTEGAKATLDALEAGAVDFIPKRFEEISRQRSDVQKIFCEKVINIAKQGLVSLRNKPVEDLKTTYVKKPDKIAIPIPADLPENVNKNNIKKLLAIGTSTGGPVALQVVLANLPAELPVPIILVQHMPQTFTPAFAKRLDQCCKITVKEAEHGDVLSAGTAYLAPGGKQMSFSKQGSQFIIDIADSNPSLTYKPSIDITFSSLAAMFKDKVLGIILTGMGADGCEGSKKLKSAGSMIWAQDKESSVIYGMPSAVYEAGITDKVLSIKEFSAQIVKYV